MSTTSKSCEWLVSIFSLALSNGALADEVTKIEDSFGFIEEFDNRRAQKLMPDNAQANDQESTTILPLLSISSFPMRVTNYDAEGDNWDALPETAIKPKQLIRSYSSNNCRFALVAETFSIDLESKSPDLSNTQQSIPPRTIQQMNAEISASLIISAELTVKIRPETKAFCRQFFSEKQVLFGTIALANDSVFLTNRAGDRITLKEERTHESKSIYLSWDQKQDRLVVTDSIGLTVDIKSSSFILPTMIEGNYYLNYDPSWSIERITGQLASH